MKTDTHDWVPTREGSGAFGQIRRGVTSVDVEAIQKRARALRDEWVREQANAFWRRLRIAFRRLWRRAAYGLGFRARLAMKR